MAIDLSTYKQIGSALAVRIDVDQYKTTDGPSYTQQTLTFSDSLYPLVINGQTYTPLMDFVSITSTSNELRSSGSPLTISIGGIRTNRMQEIMNSKFKGSAVEVWRVLFDPVTNEVLDIEGNPAGRFFGIINNYSVDESWDQANRSSSLTIAFECTSLQTVFDNKLSGRKTNSQSHRGFYPNDPSMDRVTALAGANFDFGAKQ